MNLSVPYLIRARESILAGHFPTAQVYDAWVAEPVKCPTCLSARSNH